MLKDLNERPRTGEVIRKAPKKAGDALFSTGNQKERRPKRIMSMTRSSNRNEAMLKMDKFGPYLKRVNRGQAKKKKLSGIETYHVRGSSAAEQNMTNFTMNASMENPIRDPIPTMGVSQMLTPAATD